MYTYEKISDGEIRVLELKPGSFEDVVRCNLRIVRLDDAAEYEAISYVWGDSNDTTQILCSDTPKNVTVNLYAALKHFRYESQTRLLWADALCINQADISERNHQVKLMGNIYAGASRTLIWLGEETKEVKGALKELPNFCRYKVPPVDWKLAKTEWTWSRGFVFSSENLTDEAVNYLRYLQQMLVPTFHLFRRPWWLRRWVIQEIVQSREAILVCGHSCISWNELQGCFDQHFVKSCTMLCPLVLPGHLPLVKGTSALVGMKHLLWLQRFVTSFRSRFVEGSDQLSLTLQELISATEGFQCSDPRDKLYSLLSIAQDIQSPHEMLLRVDYDESLGSLSARFAEYVIRTARRPLQYFRLVHGVRQEFSESYQPECQSAPSWAYGPLDPSFPQREDITHPLYHYNAGRAHDNHLPTWQFSADNRILSVRGAIIGEITEIVFSHSTIHNQGRNLWIKALRATKSALGTDGDNPTPVMDFFIDLMTCGRASTLKSAEQVQSYYETLSAILGLELNASPSSDAYMKLIQGMSLNADIVGVLQSLHKKTIRQLCVTSSRHCGWVPQNAQVGDQICVFPGDEDLYVIAPCGQGHHNLIGTCYIQGLMWGEALDLGLEMDWIRLY